MKHAVATALLSAITLAAYAADCKQGYKTTIVLQLPDGTPASGASITVEVNCGNGGDRTSTTNSEGEAEFPYSLDDLGGMKIVFAGFATQSIPKGNCSGPEKDKRCVVRLGT